MIRWLFIKYPPFGWSGIWLVSQRGFPSDSVVKNSPANAGDVDLIPVLERSPGEGNGNSLQYPCLGNSMDRGALWVVVHGVAKELEHNWVTKQQNISQAPCVPPPKISSFPSPTQVTAHPKACVGDLDFLTQTESKIVIILINNHNRVFRRK